MFKRLMVKIRIRRKKIRKTRIKRMMMQKSRSVMCF